MGALPKCAFSAELCFFLILTLLVIPINASSCIVDSNQSLGDVSKLPENYEYSCSNPLTLNFGNFSCITAVDRMCVDSIINKTDYITSLLRDDSEKQAFAPAISRLQNVSSYVLQAQIARTSIFRSISDAMKDTCNQTFELMLAGGVLSVSIPILGQLSIALFSGCVINEFWYVSDADTTLTSVEKALTYNSQGMNLAMGALQDESDDLYCMGAGDQSYTGQERATYNKVRDVIIDSKITADVSGTNPSFSKKWSALLQNSWNMYNYFYTLDQTCTASSIINSSLSDTGVFSQILGMYREINLAKQSLNNSYISKIDSTSLRLNKIKSDLSQAKNQKYGTISSDEINFFLKNWSQGLEEFPDPARTIQNVSDAASGIGESAESLFKEAKQLYDLRQKFYVTNAITKLNKAESKLNYADMKMASLEDAIKILLSDAEDKTSKMRTTARSSIDNFKIRTAAAELYVLSESKWNAAEQIYSSIPQKPKGEQIHDYYLAYLGYKSSFDLTSNTGIEQSYLSSKRACNELNKTIYLADADQIDILASTIILDGALSLINRSFEKNSASGLEDVRIICENETNQIYSLAFAKYSSLIDRRLRIKDEIALLRNINADGSAEKESSFLKYEGYVINDNFTTVTLGHYKEIEKLYDSIESDLRTKKSAAFAKYFSEHTSIKNKIIPSIVYVDEKTETITRVEITNTLRIGSNESFYYILSGIGIGPEDVISVSDPIMDVTGNSSAINIFFRNTTPSYSYSITIKKKEKLANSSSGAWQRILLDFTELRERKNFEINSAQELNYLVFNTTYQRPATFCEAFLDGTGYISTLDNNNISVTFPRLRQGKTSGYFECYASNPITLTKGNHTISNNTITYYLYAKSNIGNIDDVWLSFTVSSQVEGETVRVYTSSNYLASESSYTKYGSDYVIKWKAPVLSNNPSEYRIVLEVSDLFNYTSNKLTEINSSANAIGINVSSYLAKADSEINTLQYKEALETLAAAEKLINDKIALDSKKDALMKQMQALSDKINSSISNTSSLMSIGLSDVVIELDKKKNEFQSKLQQFNSALGINDTSNALKLLRDMELLADMKSVDNILYKKETDIFEDLNKLKTKMLLLNRVEDTSTYLSEIEKAESKIPLLGQDISNNDYSSFSSKFSEISDAISNISDVEKVQTNKLETLLDTKISEVKLVISTWKNLKSNIQKAIEVDSSNPGKAMNTDSINAGIADVDSKIAKLTETLKMLQDLSTLETIEKIDDINYIQSDLDDLNHSFMYLETLERQYKSDAEDTFNLGRKSLEWATAEVSDEEKDQVTNLATYLAKAKQSYESGKYLDSMLYSDFVRTSSENLKRKTTISIDPAMILVGLILVASLVLTVLLLKKEKPKEVKILEKAHG